MNLGESYTDLDIDMLRAELDRLHTENARLKGEVESKSMWLREAANSLRTHREALEKLIASAQDHVDFDQEEQVPVCRCCSMELHKDGTGHRQNCLANLCLATINEVLK